MMTPKNAELIAVGTELLLGQISNTNGQWISKELAKYGINVHYHTVVGDNLGRVEHVFKEAHTRSDLIIVCGGLGPTQDDMTREAFQSLSHKEITIHEPSLENIESFFKERDIEMTPNNKRQARIFKDAEVLMNRTGMAPGMIVFYEGKTWVFLPGVPKEMKALMANDVLPYLNGISDEQMVITSEMLRFFGIGESALEHQLRDIIARQTNPTIAPLAQENGIGIRLTAKAETEKAATSLVQQTKAIILEKVGHYYIGSNLTDITETIFQLLNKKEKNIAAAESLTGGLFADGIVSEPGASDVFQGGLVCYSTKVKTEVLHVLPETIEAYGVISKECATEMAENIMELLNASIGISFTGVAGPDSVEDKPVGTVYIGITDRSGTQSVEGFHFRGGRESIRKQAVLKGYDMLYKFLSK